MFYPVCRTRVPFLNRHVVRDRYDQGAVEDLSFKERFCVVPGGILVVQVYAVFSSDLNTFCQTLTTWINGALFDGGSVSVIFAIVFIEGREGSNASFSFFYREQTDGSKGVNVTNGIA